MSVFGATVNCPPCNLQYGNVDGGGLQSAHAASIGIGVVPAQNQQAVCEYCTDTPLVMPVPLLLTVRCTPSSQ